MKTIIYYVAVYRACQNQPMRSLTLYVFLNIWPRQRQKYVQAVTVLDGNLMPKSNCSCPVNSFCVTISFYFIFCIERQITQVFLNCQLLLLSCFCPHSPNIFIYHIPYSIFSDTLCFYPLPMLFMTRALSHHHALKRSAHSLFALSWTIDEEAMWLGGIRGRVS